MEIGHPEWLVAAICEVICLNRGIAVPSGLLGEPAVSNKRHRGVCFALRSSITWVKRTCSRFQVFDEWTLDPAYGTMVAKREVEVGKRNKRHLGIGVETYFEGFVVDVAELLHELVPCVGT